MLAPSANARVCIDAESVLQAAHRTVRRARPQLAAEYLARSSQWGGLQQLLVRRTEVRQHIVGIVPGIVLPALEVAWHYVRVIEGRLACEDAVHSMLGDDMLSVDSRK